MSRKLVELSGVALFGWFLFETIRYLYSGMIFEQWESIYKYSTNEFSIWTALAITQIIVSSFGVFILIPFMVKARSIGLVFGIIYWLWGNYTNPFWYLLPDKVLFTEQGIPTSLHVYSGFAWSFISIVILVAYFFNKRKLIQTNR
ncbi:MAG: hypothetical protein MJE63_17275 [Proteobacteria bacterium]|nr:hypothetical protein [Pseudomonadota bacterium]